MPICRIIWRNSPSAIGLLHVLPVQTNNIFKLSHLIHIFSLYRSVLRYTRKSKAISVEKPLVSRSLFPPSTPVFQ